MEKKIKAVITSKPFLFLLLLAVIWLMIVLVKTFYQKHQLDNEIANLKQEINKIDKKDQDLGSMLSYFGSQNFLEKEAKEKLNMKKEGENVVAIPEIAGGQQPAAADQPTAIDTTQCQSQEAINLAKWWKYFFVK